MKKRVAMLIESHYNHLFPLPLMIFNRALIQGSSNKNLTSAKLLIMHAINKPCYQATILFTRFIIFFAQHTIRYRFFCNPHLLCFKNEFAGVLS